MMPWEDVYFERALEQKNIIKALAHVFEVEERYIAIEFGGITGKVEDHISLICGFDIIKGDFPIHLRIAPLQHQVIPGISNPHKIIGQLCEQLNSMALISTMPGSDPYIWVLIRGDGDYQYVSVDEDLFDQPDMGLEIDDYLYNFSSILPQLEASLGVFITRKHLDYNHFQEVKARVLNYSFKEDLLQALINIRPQAKRMYREDLVQEIIDSLEQS
jgi:hypothetical protein